MFVCCDNTKQLYDLDLTFNFIIYTENQQDKISVLVLLRSITFLLRFMQFE